MSQLFLLLPFYFLCWTQIFNNLISQAGSMKLGSTPNDMMQNLETIFTLTLIPTLDRKSVGRDSRLQLISPTVIVYPVLRKFGIQFPPMRRIFVGFMCSSLAMLWACVLQYYIYKSPPNSIDVWIQAPAYVFGALSEIFVIITGLEVAFLKAPPNLRVLVSSIFWMAIAAGAALGIALSPVSKDPHMVWTYAGLSCGVFLAGCAVLVCFRHSIQGEMPVVVGIEGQDPSNTTAELAGKDGTDVLAAKVA